MNLTLGEIAAIVGGTVEGDAGARITGLNGLKEAKPGDLSFYADARYLKYLDTTPAAALMVDQKFTGDRRPIIRVGNPYFAFAQLLKHLESLWLIHPKGIHPTAVVAPTAVLGKDVALDAFAVVADGARIGDRTVLYAGVYIGKDTAIGPDCVVYPHVSIRERITIGARCIVHANSTIGSDGFGFTKVGVSRLRSLKLAALLSETTSRSGRIRLLTAPRLETPPSAVAPRLTIWSRSATMYP